MSAQVIDFQKHRQEQKKAPEVSGLALNDVKIKFIDYFDVAQIKKVQLMPVDPKCPYEHILIPLCQLLSRPRTPELAQKVAEYLMNIELKGLTLAGFIEKISRDDLIMGCFQVELKKFSQLDKLFLINVLHTNFPAEKATISLLKMFLFAEDQLALLDKEKFYH